MASERQSDLIVMGVQGRGAADLMFFGSTTQHGARRDLPRADTSAKLIDTPSPIS